MRIRKSSCRHQKAGRMSDPLLSQHTTGTPRVQIAGPGQSRNSASILLTAVIVTGLETCVAADFLHRIRNL